ncbi:MAG TPA: CpsB/CapC family capsule biosynthesis tyrosine phosphatase [Thermoanaerobaculia bacterium]|nr:CpsB/CapC family capsule biosynthesis tyrosine phosphatase [Thermoanaerobaculia bacterium]
MIDLHCHILPGIDDGPKTLEEAIGMCRVAAAEGCRAMIATPHQRRGVWWNADREAIGGLARELQAAVGPQMRILTGGEVHVDSELLAEVERLPGGGIFTLAGSRYLLLEFDAHGRAGEAISLVHELAVAGWYPVVAHPEFIPWLAEDLELAGRLVSLGASMQVTAMSVTGDFGKGPQADTHALIDAGLAHFVASDCHGLQRRPPGLRRAYQLITGRWGADVAKRLVSDNPRAVVQNRPLPELERPKVSEA